jgi:hypothetical protein
MDPEKLKKLVTFFNSEEKLSSFKNKIKDIESEKKESGNQLEDFPEELSTETGSLNSDFTSETIEIDFQEIKPIASTTLKDDLQEDTVSNEPENKEEESSLESETSKAKENEDNSTDQLIKDGVDKDIKELLSILKEPLLKEDVEEEAKPDYGKVLKIDYEFKATRSPIRYPTQDIQNSLTIWGKVRNTIDIDLLNNRSVGFLKSMNAKNTITEILKSQAKESKLLFMINSIIKFNQKIMLTLNQNKKNQFFILQAGQNVSPSCIFTLWGKNSEK